jgi:hypothetical protein
VKAPQVCCARVRRLVLSSRRPLVPPLRPSLRLAARCCADTVARYEAMFGQFGGCSVPEAGSKACGGYHGPRYYRAATPVSINCATAIARAKAESEGPSCCARVRRPGLSCIGAFVAAVLEAADRCRGRHRSWPALLPGATPVSIGSAVPIALAEAAYEGCRARVGRLVPSSRRPLAPSQRKRCS